MAKKRERLEEYVRELEKVYGNLRETLGKYVATKGEFKWGSENPSFRKIVDIYISTQDPFILNVIVPPFLRFARKVTENTMRGKSLIETGFEEEASSAENFCRSKKYATTAVNKVPSKQDNKGAISRSP